MNLTDVLMSALTDPDTPFEDPPYDLSSLTDEELGALFAESRAVTSWTTAASRANAAIVHAANKRQPRFTPEALRRLFEALVERTEKGSFAHVGPALTAVEHCTGPLPDLTAPIRALLELRLAELMVRQPYALLSFAHLAGEEAVRETVAGFSRNAGPIVADEMATVAGLPREERDLLAGIDRDHRHGERPPADDWRRPAAHSGYVAFARRALEAAADRTDAIRSGELPYRAEKAFTDREVLTLGQAARIALLRDEPWLPAVFDRLLPGVALAPTAAKTLPSQALLYELVRAAQDFPTPELVTTIRTVRRDVRHAGVPKQLDKMLKKVEAALAERTDVALRLPRLDFPDDGVLRRTAGDYAAVVTVTESAALTWEKDGRPLRAAPAPVRRDHPELVKELRALVKRVDAQLITLARALEGGLAVDTVHPYAWWRTELAAHPLARTAVRRLIWEIEVAPGVWEAVLPEVADELPEGRSVRLWHPLRADADAVRAWRDLLTEAGVRQPFKQAFREIYRLTPAEEETRVYSNRFAGHLVHYHRLFALFRARGWSSRRIGPWDDGDGDAADRVLGAGEWRIRFHHTWYDWAGEDEIASTDQVRFDRRAEGDGRVGGGWREVPLTEVPELVFSEAMRDVDLFVGVTSIAADPDWADGGPERTYWERASVAELPETAQARRDALERIVPRLKIADRCSFDGRFLVVRGELRTYRIHLGSANVLMEPDGAYLCIVPAPEKGKGKVFLPFEDARLSLILSKAFLLAADKEITDETIRRQMGGRGSGS
ncbi:hypothetical protein BN159_3318 [Streptomyces davaonensis JCM 4913]|uniref:Uncharacterized protein n=1 Tax=Streptomyces davaonensis (strain DSM 101723 / JCM 4913 / KCC S-0913 / 768) TaxID=1214101 RepID=K4R3H7_STRDJ|nr:DUF4132 domain-containing protein [Streptomyces davaonensis]CCK27697.1 hypothetical protein BN159_3318 [Streptomyces davaonensis JCM 4913]